MITPDELHVIVTEEWGAGFAAAKVGGEKSYNPHPPETVAWGDWNRGYDACMTAEWTTIEIDDDLAKMLDLEQSHDN